MKSKLLLVAFGLFFMSTQVKAQDLVRFSPFSLIKLKAKFHYEHGFETEKIGIGVIASGYFGLFPGYRIQPFARYYFMEKALKGFYIQPKLHFSQNSYEVLNVDQDGILLEGTAWESIEEYGGSLSLGWQFLFGPNENIVLDLFAGLRVSNLQKFEENSVATGSYLWLDVEDDEDLYRIIHSNIFDFGLSAGYKF